MVSINNIKKQIFVETTLGNKRIAGIKTGVEQLSTPENFCLTYFHHVRKQVNSRCTKKHDAN